jgi:hypothetical protein
VSDEDRARLLDILLRMKANLAGNR